ncbi:MAG: AsmA family protein, partial [Bacteroidota bacterium]
MLKRILRWLLVLLGLLALVLVIAVVVINNYLASTQEKLLHEAMASAGLKVAFRELDLRIWRTFPEASISLDSLVLRDSTRSLQQPPLLQVEKFSVDVSVASILSKTLDIRKVELNDAALYLKSDSTGIFNAGQLFTLGSTNKKAPVINLNWDGLIVDLTEVDLQYHHAISNKQMEALVHRLKAEVYRPEADSVRLKGELDLYSRGIAFNTEVGAYLQETPLSGQLEVSLDPTAWTLSPTRLSVGEQEFTASASISRQAGDTSYLHLANENLDYERSRLLLHDVLQERLTKYHVSTPFPVTARIATTLEQNDDPEIATTFTLNGQSVRLLQNNFKDVHLNGTFINRLSPAKGGIPGSRKNLFFSLDSVSGYREDVFIT